MTPSCILHPSISLRRLRLPPRRAAPEWEKLSSATMELNSHKSLAFLRLPSGHCNNQHNRRTQIRTELHSSYSFTLDGLPSRLSVAPSADLILIGRTLVPNTLLRRVFSIDASLSLVWLRLSFMDTGMSLLL